jgi:RNA polymerase sigma factor (sigma-70 family)
MRTHHAQEILAQLTSDDVQQTKRALLYLHQKVYDQIKNFILQAKGDVSDVEDVFQDGLFTLLKMIRQSTLPQELNIEAYLFTICKNRWIKQLSNGKTANTFRLIPDMDVVSNEPDSLAHLQEAEQEKVMALILDQLGAKCQQLLIYYYYEKKKMKEIANIMGFSSEQIAKNQKLKCLQKLREIISSCGVEKKWFYDNE